MSEYTEFEQSITTRVVDLDTARASEAYLLAQERMQFEIDTGIADEMVGDLIVQLDDGELVTIHRSDILADQREIAATNAMAGETDTSSGPNVNQVLLDAQLRQERNQFN